MQYLRAGGGTTGLCSLGRFVATFAFTPDVKVWEVKFSRLGEFEKVARAFDLVTVSKDGTWKVFDTAVEYTKGQDPTVIMSGSYIWDSNLFINITISPEPVCIICL